MVTYRGGVDEYGRSCFLLEMAGQTIMVDCGISKSAKNAMERYPALKKEEVQQIDAVFLTHAHEDHTLGLPFMKKLGLNAPVFATSAVIHHTKLYFRLWRQGAQPDETDIPYQLSDEESLLFQPLDHNQRLTWHEMLPGVECMIGFNGHAPGSCWFLFREQNTEFTVFFSGDYSMSSALFPFDMPPEMEADIGVFDAAYGALDTSQFSCKEEIFEKLEDCVSKQKNVAFHVPFSGKGQDWLYLLASWCRKTGIRLSVDPFLLEETKRLLDEQVWLDVSASSKLQSLLTDPGLISAEDRSDDALLLFTDHRLQNKRTDQENGSILITTGPVSPDLNRYAYETASRLMKFPYHVHPVLNESRFLFERVQPDQYILTHAPFKIAYELEYELENVRD